MVRHLQGTITITMLYLLRHDRATAELKFFKEYQDTERALALNDWRGLELEYNLSHGSHEVVLLQAKNRALLRKTHPKYDIPETTGEKLFTAALIVGLIAALTS